MVQYSITSGSTVKKVVKNLDAGMLYYARLRTVKTVSDTDYYSAWSPVKSIRPVSVTIGETVYVTKSGDKYHLDGCRYLSKSRIAMKYEDAKKDHKPCSVCLKYVN